MRSVLGIDAAWTEKEPSGVALIIDDGTGWRLVEVSASYGAFLDADNAAVSNARHRGSMPEAQLIISASSKKSSCKVDLVAIDMPLSKLPITGRRVSDNMISTAYGARHASTHTPSALRPGQLSDELRLGFDAAGYPLSVSEPIGNALVEVYPHPALMELATSDRRLPYKFGKISKYWPEDSLAARRHKLLETWSVIIDLLEARIRGVATALPRPAIDARGYEMKAFEDKMDAVVCAWVGACVLDGRAAAYGDNQSAIWVPNLAPD